MATDEDIRAHVITGDRDEVGSALRRAHADGRLIAVTDARVLHHNRVRVVADLRMPPPARTRWERCRPWLVGAGKVLAALAAVAAVAGLVWLVAVAVLEVIALVTALIAWVHTHLIHIGLAVAALVALLIYLSAGSRCAGLHCGGCRR